MNAILKAMGAVLFVMSIVMVLLEGTGYEYLALMSPRQPDPVSGHIIPVTFATRNMLNHVGYLTQSDKTLLGVSYLFGGVGLIGIFGFLLGSGKLKNPTSFW